MAVMDSRAEFADATTIPVGTGRGLMGNVMDLGKARNVGNGQPVYLVVSIDTAVTSAGAATCSFELVSDAQAAIATDGTATQHAKSPDFPKATLTAGFRWVTPLPPEGDTPYEEFLGVIANVGTAALTAGKANAYLTLDPPKEWKAYDDGIQAI